jgi:hypothetical protein
LSSAGVSSSEKAAILQVLQDSPPPTVKVWFDAAQLLRRMSAELTLNGMGGSAGPVRGTMTMDFSHYGAPVSITAPAPSDVMSYTQFQHLTGA